MLAISSIAYARPISFHWMGGGGHMSHMSLLRFVFTLIVCPQEEYVEGVHRSRRVEVPQKPGRALPCVAARDACCASVPSAAGALLAFFDRHVYYGGQR